MDYLNSVTAFRFVAGVLSSSGSVSFHVKKCYVVMRAYNRHGDFVVSVRISFSVASSLEQYLLRLSYRPQGVDSSYVKCESMAALVSECLEDYHIDYSETTGL